MDTVEITGEHAVVRLGHDCPCLHAGAWQDVPLTLRFSAGTWLVRGAIRFTGGPFSEREWAGARLYSKLNAEPYGSAAVPGHVVGAGQLFHHVLSLGKATELTLQVLRPTNWDGLILSKDTVFVINRLAYSLDVEADAPALVDARSPCP
jgi:hypothetical protein